MDDKINNINIDGYNILEKIGEGASSIVYKALNKNLDRIVALKVLKPELINDINNYLERFEREGKILAKLNSNNVVSIYSINVQDDIKYIEMEYVEGKPFTQIIDKLNNKELLVIFKEILETLDLIHKNKIIVRDLKSDNIIIDTKNRRVVIIDFGLSKYLNGFSDNITFEKVIIGTPLWLSPESFIGSESITEKSDLFSAGLLFLSGIQKMKVPFDNITNWPNLYYQIQNVENKIDELKLDDNIKKLLRMMLSAKPENRSDINLIIKEIENIILDKNKKETVEEIKNESLIDTIKQYMNIKNIIGFIIMMLYIIYELINRVITK